MQTIAGAGYEVDFALWAQEQAAALREGRFDALDIENVSEEIEALGRSTRAELRSRLATLMMHLLKLEYQPKKATRSWEITIVEQAAQIVNLLEESPSLAPAFIETRAKAYKSARRQAAIETGLPLEVFPDVASPDLLIALDIALKEALAD